VQRRTRALRLTVTSAASAARMSPASNDANRICHRRTQTRRPGIASSPQLAFSFGAESEADVEVPASAGGAAAPALAVGAAAPAAATGAGAPAADAL